jgi:hypothetical protein
LSDEVIGDRDRDRRTSELPRRLQAQVPVHHAAVAAGDDRNPEAEFGDGGTHPVNNVVVAPLLQAYSTNHSISQCSSANGCIAASTCRDSSRRRATQRRCVGRRKMAQRGKCRTEGFLARSIEIIGIFGLETKPN